MKGKAFFFINCLLMLLTVSSLKPVSGQQYYRDAIENARASRALADGKAITDTSREADPLYRLLLPVDAKDYLARSICDYADRIIGVEMVVDERSSKLAHDQPAQLLATDGLDRQFKAMKRKLESDHISALRDKTTLVRRQVIFSIEKMKDDIGSLCNYSTSSSSTNSGPTRASAETFLKKTCADKVELLTNNLEKDCWQIDSLYDQKLRDLIVSQANLNGQMASKSGSNQVAAQGSNMYVHNYINFGASSSVPKIEPAIHEPVKALMATPYSLDKTPNSKRR